MYACYRIHIEISAFWWFEIFYLEFLVNLFLIDNMMIGKIEIAMIAMISKEKWCCTAGILPNKKPQIENNDTHKKAPTMLYITKVR